LIEYAFAGSDSTAAIVLRKLSQAQPPKLVITREDAPFGRKREMRQTEVAEVAIENQIPIAKANNPSNVLDDIRQSGASRGIVVSYGAILKNEVLGELDWFNLHFSLLPKYRGAAPVQRAIMENQTESGISVFRIDEGMDTGKVYAQESINIKGLNTFEALELMANESIPLLERLLVDPEPQLTPQSGDASYAKKLTREECFLDFSKSASELNQIVLASFPEPVAWTTHKGQPLKIIRSRTNGLKFSEDLPPGTVEKVAGKISVVCGDSARLELLEVQPFSKKPMTSNDWFNGVGETVLGN
jgi:methionyl-tRNA formyltransferase